MSTLSQEATAAGRFPPFFLPTSRSKRLPTSRTLSVLQAAYGEKKQNNQFSFLKSGLASDRQTDGPVPYAANAHAMREPGPGAEAALTPRKRQQVCLWQNAAKRSPAARSREEKAKKIPTKKKKKKDERKGHFSFYWET